MVGLSRRSRRSNTKNTPQPKAAAAVKTFRHNLAKKTATTVLVLCAMVTPLLISQYQYQQSSANLSSIMYNNNNDTVAEKQVVGSKEEEEVAHVQILQTSQQQPQLGRNIPESDNSTAKFCGSNKWLGSNISCEKRAQFLVSSYQTSEQNASLVY
jgi:hypothetical protein